MNAAAAAAGEGASVVLLEKTSGFSARGGDNAAIGTTLQKEQGIEIDKIEVLRYEAQWSKHKINHDLFKVWLYRSGDIFDEIIALCEEAGYASGRVQSLPPHKDILEPFYRMYPTNISIAMTPAETDADGNPIMPQTVYLRILEGYSLDHGVDIRYNTPAVQLVTDNSGAVTGIIAGKEDGSYLKVNTKRGVILATGDIAGDKEMVKAFSPLPLHNLNAGSGVIEMYSPPGANTGDAFRMGMPIGAIPQLAPPAPMIHVPAAQMPFGPPYIGWLQVNNQGERFHEEEPNEVSNANALMVQPGSQAWWFFDGGYYDKVLAMQPENSGFFGAPFVDDTTQAVLDGLVESGDVLKGDTIEELARAIGVPVETFVSTVERYNRICANGSDTDFGKREVWLSGTALDTPPYYAAPINAFWFVIMYGLHCNKYSQVLNGKDEVIPGLFAIGNAQGDFFADDYPLLTPGISHGRAAVFGRLVGKALAHGELYELGF
jgi:succinate dehydrogenase/fumarate reductase flavoprotein subunit